jgi:hypothetical protein
MAPSVIRVFLLDKRHNVAALAHRLAAYGYRATPVLRDADDYAYAGAGDPDDQVLEIAEHDVDWPGLVRFAKQRELEFCVVCGAGFRGIRLDYCPDTTLPTEHFGRPVGAAAHAGEVY